MKLNLYKSVALCSLLALAGCHDFEEMNTNPNAPVYDPSVMDCGPEGIDIDYTISESALESLKATESALGSIFFNFTYEGLYNDYQIATNLTHDVYAAYNGSNGFLNNSPAYAYNDGWSAARWKHFYDDRTIAEYSQLIKTFWFCNKEYYHNAFYITRIYYAFLLSAQTDTYGDIPIQYYVKGAMPPTENVTYTPQKEVYDIIFKLLDQAITGLHNPPAVDQYSFSAEDDRIYGGKVEPWIRFANTLRLRLALRVSNVAPEVAREQGEKALSDPSGLMKGQEDNMKLIPKRQWITGGNENIFALMFSWGASCVLPKEMEWAYKNQALKEGVDANASGFVEKVARNADEEGTIFGLDATKYNEKEANCYLDPRCKILFFRPSPYDPGIKDDYKAEDPNAEYGGYRNGAKEVGSKYTVKYSPMKTNLKSDEMLPDCWWNQAREIVWLGYSESLFLRAEAALRGWGNETGTAVAGRLYEDGVRASMDYYGIASDKAEEYIDHLEGKKAFKEGGSREEQLEQIITQKWLAVYPNGNEGWAEVRRTDYPRYLLLPRYGNNSSGEVENTKLIKRVSYPNSESRNPNKPAYTQGTKVWWDVADTMDETGKWKTPDNFR